MIMHRLRKIKSIKANQPNSSDLGSWSPQQQAKSNLIQQSQNYVFQDQEPAILSLPSQPATSPAKDMGASLRRSCKGETQLIRQLRNLAEELRTTNSHHKLVAGSQREYQTQDYLINVNVKSPVALSSYVVTGQKRQLPGPRFQPSPSVPQYVLRQQRRVSKLRRQLFRNETEASYHSADQKQRSQDKGLSRQASKQPERKRNNSLFAKLPLQFH